MTTIEVKTPRPVDTKAVPAPKLSRPAKADCEKADVIAIAIVIAIATTIAIIIAIIIAIAIANEKLSLAAEAAILLKIVTIIFLIFQKNC